MWCGVCLTATAECASRRVDSGMACDVLVVTSSRGPCFFLCVVGLCERVAKDVSFIG